MKFRKFLNFWVQVTPLYGTLVNGDCRLVKGVLNTKRLRTADLTYATSYERFVRSLDTTFIWLKIVIATVNIKHSITIKSPSRPPQQQWVLFKDQPERMFFDKVGRKTYQSALGERKVKGRTGRAADEFICTYALLRDLNSHKHVATKTHLHAPTNLGLPHPQRPGR